jgi:hypothetical protein
MRKHVLDNSTAVSLFPFIAVLLCTMGALLIVLVSVTRLARERAESQAASPQAVVSVTAEDSEARQRLQNIREHAAKLLKFRAQAEHQLREDEARLTHLEEQMRRFEDQIAGLKMSIGELTALGEEHFDDRRQAERELSRLRELIADTGREIDSLKKNLRSKKRSYAIVPYEGPNGTRRRPIYIECRGDEVILQPEGVRLTEQDLQPPIDAGNPLAAAIRAARELLLREASASEMAAVDPYPLILIRPDGVAAYYAVRQAIESWDGDFGYEFVDGEWDLKYQAADPQLAKVEQQAIEQARIRRQVLAAAAPRMFGSGGGFAGGRFELVDEEDEFFGEAASGEETGIADGPSSRGGGKPEIGALASGSHGNNEHATTSEQKPKEPTGSGRAGGGATNAISAAPSSSALVAPEQSGSSQAESAAAEISSGQVGGTALTSNGASVSAAAGGISADASATASTNSGAGRPQPGQPNGTGPDSSADNSRGQNASVTFQPVADKRGADWAIKSKGQAAVPVRRTIQVVVREDRFAVLPDDTAPGESAKGGQQVLFDAPTSAHVDDIVKAVQQHVEEWGMAGQGLYWRPVLVVHTGPDGARRAKELSQLLKESGIELRTPSAIGQRGSNQQIPR